MSSTGRVVASFGFLFLPLIACSSRSTGQEVIDEVAPPICEKVKMCSGDAPFLKAYPGGVDECVTKTKATVRTQRGDDLDKSSACTDDEISTCIDSYKAAACKANGSPPDLPCDC